MKGTVISWTVVHRPPEGFEEPQRIVLVRTDDGGMVLAIVADGRLLRTGARVWVSAETTGQQAAESTSGDAG